MASTRPPKGQIKRVPVPVRHPAPAPAAPISITSPPAIARTTLSSNPPLTQNPFIARGQHRPRGPVPIVETNSHQPLPAYPNHDHGYTHYSHQPQPYTLHIIGMDPESQHRHSTLPPQVEDDIKAAVLASMASNGHAVPMKKRRTVVHKKRLRWTSLSLCGILIIGEIPVCLIYGVDISALFAFILGTLLALWNGWRLFRLRQKFDNEIISGWHIGLEITSLAALVAITPTVAVWTSNPAQRDGLWDTSNSDFRLFWRGIAVAIFFVVIFILHFVLFIITVVEKWTKPAYVHTALAGDAQTQQPPQIIVQYTPACPVCHGHEPRPGEDENTYLASIGDSQPQGVAPVMLGQQKEAMYTDESLNEHDYYGAGARVRT
ncbi:hypothetical protein GGR55DRAFT_675773 [Xylaria sp. FL0064]|nr:hypothetical protein GGR55DRAFT_675773 [Xylaria sp. FL0064]